MMTRQNLFLLKSLLIAACVFALASPATAQERANEEARVSPNAAVSQTVGTTEVDITYGRPSVRGRQIYGDLVPFGEVWRTGANEATTISFSDDVTIEGQALPAGTYSLFTVPNKDSWTIIFNKVPQQWGSYDYDANQDALRVTVSPERAPHREQLSFSFENVTENAGVVQMHWADVLVPFRVEVR